ncbi:MAG: hypothetical protein CYPHOPRED_004613, partial [Cyphobasidiales sp. Tagirdzhanova-0007]
MFALTSFAVGGALLPLLARAANHTVLVGPGALIYSPNNTIAAINDSVTFVFAGGMHSVSQSSFDNPCQHLQNVTFDAVGFDTGIIPVNASLGYPTVTYFVTSTDPVWFYCKQVGHCVAGMAGAINAPLNGSQTVEAFIALAKNSTIAGSISNATVSALASPSSTGIGLIGGNATTLITALPSSTAAAAASTAVGAVSSTIAAVTTAVAGATTGAATAVASISSAVRQSADDFLIAATVGGPPGAVGGTRPSATPTAGK